jgi:5-hydroxyisourate hydrolase
MISTHVLDTSKGLPAAEIEVTLQFFINGEWKNLEKQKTNLDGRVSFSTASQEGIYQLIFSTKKYFEAVPSFYRDIPVIFHITDCNRKYHVPLLLNPFGYSTYRGS